MPGKPSSTLEQTWHLDQMRLSSSPNPFLGLHAAVTRQRVDGRPGPGGWIPEQRLPLFDALQAYTIGPAKTAGWDDRLGCLIPGSYADLIILDRNPFEIPPDELADLSPTCTMMNGEWVFNK